MLPETHKKNSYAQAGLSLVELGIVLVVIGLICGGILTGRDLIDAAAVRAQVVQINKYNAAVSAFQSKYGYLPGDIPNPYAATYGFQARGVQQGEGDGNGIIEGNCSNGSGNDIGFQTGCGELAVFWEDLSEAGLIDTIIYGYDTKGAAYPYMLGPGVSPVVSKWLPQAKIGNGQYVYVASNYSINYFVVQKVSIIGWSTESTGTYGGAANAMTVQQAYNIDKKMDDGLPQSGAVIACDADYDVAGGSGGPYFVWAAGSNHQGAGGTAGNGCSAPSTAATSYQTYNCYDNNNIAGAQTYSTAKNANAYNCALSFAF